MAYIRTLNSGKYQATVRLKGIKRFKTFATKQAAKTWAAKLDKHIKLIPTLTSTQLLSLSNVDIESMGGDDIFKKLGIDLFGIRHASKLEEINQLSKKELPLLTAEQIESMGGLELFKYAGKDSRIRYKTFQSVCDEYIESWCKQYKDKDNQILRVKFWCDFFGHRIITDIDLFDIREQLDKLIKSGQRLATVSRKKAVLSSIFKYALSECYIDRNIVRDAVVGNDSKPRNRVLNDDERLRLLEACKRSKWDRLYMLVLLAITTGARKGELLKLRWNDVDFQSSSGQLEDTKNGSSRMLVFPSIVMQELKQFQEIGNGLIFESGRNPKKPKDIRKSWAAALKVAEISDKDTDAVEKFTFHCLRHGFCSALSDSGKELSEISGMAGHKSIQTTMRYIHQGEDRKREIVDELTISFGL